MPTKKAQGHIDGFDAIELWLDRPELPFPVSDLYDHCTEVTPYIDQQSFHADRKLKLRLSQPTLKCLQLLSDGLGSECNAVVTYVEVARDIVVPNRRRRMALHGHFLASARVKCMRDRARHHKETTTWYYSKRKTKRGLAVYADKPSKINNARPNTASPKCLHVEMRLRGKAALGRTGIAAIDDLIDFDFDKFWASQLCLFQMPSKTKLGRMLLDIEHPGKNVSDTALLKRANRWMKLKRTGGRFVLHNALLGAPKLQRKLDLLSWSEWLNLGISKMNTGD